MSQQELLIRTVRVLLNANVDYMVTGSVASSLQGEPRSSHDIDLVVALSPDAIPKLLQAFPPPDYYLSEPAMVGALQSGSMFNLLRTTDGEKVDFWMLTHEAFDKSRFARKRLEPYEGTTIFVSTPEDTILAKLRWAELSGGSEKQFADALHVYEVQSGALDMDYLNHWVTQLGVEELWQRLRNEAEPV
jgi:hypothetical protein